MRQKNLVAGTLFGKLTVLSEAAPVKTRAASLVKCECGREKIVLNYNLKSGATTACGQCRPRKSLIGQRFTRLLVIGDVAPKLGSLQWRSLCQCDCGKQKVIANSALKSGNTRSCDCLHAELQSEMMTTHGQSGGKIRIQTRAYACWRNIKKRCLNPNSTDFPKYGGKGIKLCERWKESFDNFLADMGECPPGLTIERIDSNGNYEPGNCKWASYFAQSRNKSTNVIITFGGHTGCLKDVCAVLGKDYETVKSRLRRNWPMEDAFAKPRRQGCKGGVFRSLAPAMPD